MNLQMIGIDHTVADIEEREAFAFTRHQCEKALKDWKKEELFTGAVLLSTCNRTELWVSGAENMEPADILLSRKGLDFHRYEKIIIRRSGYEAIEHLLHLICGLKSKIYGEDQIITQIRDALMFSQEHQCTDTTIEKVFQTAIAAGKKVKTHVSLQSSDPSAAGNTLKIIGEMRGCVKGAKCLIIGNGQMGLLVANQLIAAGADVTMTLRKKYHKDVHQTSIIPEGCRMIDYEDRMDRIEDYHVVVSATLSPHFTVTRESISGKSFGENTLWIDLAVPRDIESNIGDITNISLYNMDMLGDRFVNEKSVRAHEKALGILSEYVDELETWFMFREHIDKVKRISANTAKDACMRMEHKSFEDAVDDAVEKLVFGLKKTLPKESWETVLAALEESSNIETLKTGAKER